MNTVRPIVGGKVGKLKKIELAKTAKKLRSKEKVFYSPECVKTIAQSMELFAEHPYINSMVRFIDSKTRLKITKRRHGKSKRFDGEILICVGKPNYAERNYIKKSLPGGLKNKMISEIVLIDMEK